MLEGRNALELVRDIEARQDEVLRRLDELDLLLEQALAAHDRPAGIEVPTVAIGDCGSSIAD
jgi:hypothetical protein